MAVPGGSARRGATVGEIQRERILDAVAEVVAARGVAGTSVGLVLTRARVSRRVFYERFEGLDECLIAVLDGALARTVPLVVGAFAGAGSWQDGMRGALAAMLSFFDAEPALARVCLVELGTATPVVRDHREGIFQAFRTLVVERIDGEVSHLSPLASEGILASVVGIVNTRLVDPERAPLIELLGPLMGIIVGPFMDDAQVAREIERGDELARELRELHTSPAPHPGDGLSPIPDVLLTERAHRARLCLQYVAEQSGRVGALSNQQVGRGIGVSHRGQVARLLGMLAALGLLDKRSGSPGHPNAWSLTLEGERVARSLAKHSDTSP